MSPKLRIASALLLLLLACPSFADRATGQRGIVATVHPIATQAAIEAFKKGGNAVDAAVAAALTLGVVDGHNSGIGGGCLMLIRRPDGTFLALDGRETAPASATRDMFVRDGRADTRLSQTGALASGVPGSLAVYELALARHGKLRLADLLNAAARIAETGFTLSPSYAKRIEETQQDIARFQDTAGIFLDPQRRPWKAGHRLIQRDLAATYRNIAVRGTDWFYRGAFAHQTEAWMRSNGGILNAVDFRDYHVKEREPVRSSYHGHDIVGFPPPSSGGIHVAQILNIVEAFHRDSPPRNSVDRSHVVAEAMKLAFADRAHWLGDSDFVQVPRGLTDKTYARQLGLRIDRNHTVDVTTHGEPPDAQRTARKHTTHLSTADAAGFWVACTTTLNTSFGSKVVIPGTGVVLNNQMDDFSIQPGVTNYFGLVGAEANAVAPKKRPLSSMSPTIVLKEGRPILAIGAAGGPTIISQVVLALIGVLDLDLDVAQAIAQPRFHHQWRPDELRVEKRSNAALKKELARRGHRVVDAGALGATQGVGVSKDGGTLIGSADPRAGGRAAGW